MAFPEVLRLPERLEIKEVQLDPSESALIVIDVQNDFANPRGRLYAEGADRIIQPIKRVVAKARSAGAVIIFTQDWHIIGDPEFALWGEHAVANTWGAEIVDELRPGESDIVVRKPSYDAFYSTNLDHVLRAKGIRNLILTGLLGNVCVLCTGVGAAMRGYRLIVPVDSVFTILEFDHVAALRFMNTVLKAELTTSDKLSFGAGAR